MADGKWIEGLTPGTPPDDAARRVLAARLEAVVRWLPAAAREAERDPENVHQLRVSTRRADAALRLFRPCLPKSAYRGARGRLRTLRRAAGAARDADVFLIELRQRARKAKEKERAGLDFLVGYGMGQRAAARPALEALPVEPFAGYVPGLLAELRPPEPAALIYLARPALTGLFAALAESATGDLSDHARLHEVRIAGKRLRYALEVFAGCFPPALRDVVYPLVEEMQETLGRANDSHVAAARLIALRGDLKSWGAAGERARAGIDALLLSHQRRLPQERKRFVKWLERWRAIDVPGVLA
ncbi:MAG: CHAD domain-containing protein [Gemmataceae bacterium]